MENMRRMTKKAKKLTYSTIVYILVAACTIISIFPTVFALIISVVTETNGQTMFENPMDFFTGLTFDNFIKVFSESNIARWTLNSFIVSISQTILYLLIASLAAFGFARLKFKGIKIIFNICLLSMLVPGIINCVPNYIIISSLGLYDNILGLILPGLSGISGVFLLKQFMDNIPKDFDEAARIEGASNFTIYRRVILPMCGPALSSLALFTFQGAWNDFLWPILITSSDENRTLAAGLYKTLMADSQYRGSLMAASIISAIPIVIVFIFGQKYFTSGVGRGGLKG